MEDIFSLLKIETMLTYISPKLQKMERAPIAVYCTYYFASLRNDKLLQKLVQMQLRKISFTYLLLLDLKKYCCA